jgi:arylsulfatase A-like enzyme
MNRFILVLLLASFVPVQSNAQATDVPNIVLIFIDDLGYADIGPFGNTEVRTPHLDKLATEGMKFTSFYATPVCSMSRACLMTGCYNARVSIPGVLFPRDTIGLNPSEVTLAEIVKQKGYATCAIGKWHLGHYPEFLPTRQGFDHYFGLPYSNDMQAGRKDMPPLPLYDDDKIIETEPDQSQLTRRYTEEAVEFIRAQKDQPFFVYLPHTMVHFPLAASEAFKGKSKMGLMGDTIEEIDWSVGQIMSTLSELKLDSKTLVIFTSDNGPAKRAAPPFRGSKGSNFEGGVREPCIMRWPGKIPAGSTCNQIAGNIDILPTFAKLVGVELAKDHVIDGRDITPLMFNANAAPVRDTHLYLSGTNVAAIRKNDWKLFLKVPNDEKTSQSKKNSGSKPKKEKGGPRSSLYNLASDPGEASDVAAAHPEIVTRLREEAIRLAAELESNKRPAGRIAATK